MKKYLLTILILTFLVLSGCLSKPQSNQNTNVVPEEPEVENENVNTATTTEEIDTSDWKTYRNEEYGFEISFPEDWAFNEDVGSNYFNFSLSKGGSRLMILPIGEFDYGLPWSKPTTLEVIVSGKKAVLTVWQLNNGGELWFYQFIEDVPNWITCEKDLKKSCNRIDFFISNKEDLEILKRIFSTFTFK